MAKDEIEAERRDVYYVIQDAFFGREGSREIYDEFNVPTLPNSISP